MALVTKEGLEEIKHKLENLKIAERKAIEAVSTARGYGDLSENSELDDANVRLERIKEDKSILERFIAEASVFDVKSANKAIIGFGAFITLEDEASKERKYKIVSEMEANVDEGKISVNSPIARALQGKSKDEEIVVSAPSGAKSFVVTHIDYSWLS